MHWSCLSILFYLSPVMHGSCLPILFNLSPVMHWCYLSVLFNYLPLCIGHIHLFHSISFISSFARIFILIYNLFYFITF